MNERAGQREGSDPRSYTCSVSHRIAAFRPDGQGATSKGGKTKGKTKGETQGKTWARHSSAVSSRWVTILEFAGGEP